MAALTELEWARNPDIPSLRKRVFDLAIIGGGIHGCGIARDAAMRGLSVVLFEKGDIGSGTSSASSKLVHGGLRYLEQLRFGLVRESLRERATLLRIAPHLVRPLPFLLPLYEDARLGPLKLRAGLSIYDFLAGRARISRHGWLNAQALHEREPDVRVDGLRGGFHFSDAQMNDARLCLENAIDARRHGAEVWNYVEVERLLESENRVRGLAVRDLRDGHRFEVAAHLVVDATGPWYGRLHRNSALSRVPHARLSKGSHLVMNPLTRGHALLLTARSDGRVIFVIPYKGRSIVGTTEIEIDGSPDAIKVEDSEVEYLLDELRYTFPDAATQRSDILSSFCGVRSLHSEEGESIGDANREAEITEVAPGLLGIVGGKYTTFRAVAERCVDMVQRLLERSHPQPSRTAHTPLPGGDFPDMDDYFRVAEELLLGRYEMEGTVLRYLLGSYGTRHVQIFRYFEDHPHMREPIEPGLPFTRGEVMHAVRYEGARTLDDLIWRRCYRAFLGKMSDEARRSWEDALREALS
jgi:glycerol-3-phosphate dehydrogenase